MSLSDTFDFGEREPGNCLPWEPTYDCCEEWEDYDPDLQLRATSLAWSALRSLTGGRVGSCPVELRPCLDPNPCSVCTGTSWLSPYVDTDGNWRNLACRQDGSCSCCSMCEIIMPGPVALITRVMLDGTELDRSIFRIDNGNRLVREDGNCWPRNQDMGAPAGSPNTLVIEYIPGVLPSTSGLWAAGLLACEFAKACSGGKCRLPRAVTSIARQGVTMEFPRRMWEYGVGIQEVDAYIATLNPNRLTIPPMVWTPDMASTKHRITTGRLTPRPPTGP